MFVIGVGIFTLGSLMSGLAPNVEMLNLARILQGGTWTAGRNVAKQKRADGGPPLKIVSDGTVF